jgi:hypothetical protein
MANTRMAGRFGENAIEEADSEHTADCRYQVGVERTPVQRPMANTRMSRRVGQNASRRPVANSRMARRIKGTPVRRPMTNTLMSRRMERTLVQTPMANPRMSGRSKENAWRKASRGCQHRLNRTSQRSKANTDVRRVWRESQSRGRWRIHGCKDGLERTPVQRQAAMSRQRVQSASPDANGEHTDVQTIQRGHQGRWQTHGCQNESLV